MHFMGIASVRYALWHAPLPQARSPLVRAKLRRAADGDKPFALAHFATKRASRRAPSRPADVSEAEEKLLLGSGPAT
jgi:hypothetical protein